MLYFVARVIGRTPCTYVFDKDGGAIACRGSTPASVLRAQLAMLKSLSTTPGKLAACLLRRISGARKHHERTIRTQHFIPQQRPRTQSHIVAAAPPNASRIQGPKSLKVSEGQGLPPSKRPCPNTANPNHQSRVSRSRVSPFSIQFCPPFLSTSCSERGRRELAATSTRLESWFHLEHCTRRVESFAEPQPKTDVRRPAVQHHSEYGAEAIELLPTPILWDCNDDTITFGSIIHTCAGPLNGLHFILRKKKKERTVFSITALRGGKLYNADLYPITSTVYK